jgi:hypothetical protein
MEGTTGDSPDAQQPTATNSTTTTATASNINNHDYRSPSSPVGNLPLAPETSAALINYLLASSQDSLAPPVPAPMPLPSSSNQQKINAQEDANQWMMEQLLLSSSGSGSSTTSTNPAPVSVGKTRVVVGERTASLLRTETSQRSKEDLNVNPVFPNYQAASSTSSSSTFERNDRIDHGGFVGGGSGKVQVESDARSGYQYGNEVISEAAKVVGSRSGASASVSLMDQDPYEVPSLSQYERQQQQQGLVNDQPMMQSLAAPNPVSSQLPRTVSLAQPPPPPPSTPPPLYLTQRSKDASENQVSEPPTQIVPPATEKPNNATSSFSSTPSASSTTSTAAYTAIKTYLQPILTTLRVPSTYHPIILSLPETLPTTTRKLYASLPPSVQSKLPFLVVILLISPKLVLLSIFVGLGVLVGVIWGVEVGKGVKEGEEGTQREMNNVIEKIQKVNLESAKNDQNNQSGQYPSTNVGIGGGEMSSLPFIPTEISQELDYFLQHFTRDFIQNWYKNLNHSESPEFPDAIETSVRSGFIRLGLLFKNLKMTQVVVPIQSVIVEHLREYRKFEGSSLPLEVYISRYPQSSFREYVSNPTQHIHILLKTLARRLCYKILPEREKSSRVVMGFVTELVGTTVFKSIVEKFSDPDWINKSLIDYIKKAEAAAIEKERKEREGERVVNMMGFGGPEIGGEIGMGGLERESIDGNEVGKVKSATRNQGGNQIYVKGEFRICRFTICKVLFAGCIILIFDSFFNPCFVWF